MVIKLGDLLKVVSDSEAVFIRVVFPISNSEKIREESQTVVLLDSIVKNIKMDGSSMLFIDVEPNNGKEVV